MEFDRNPQMTLFADKVAVKDFVASKIGSKCLINTIGIFDSLQGLVRDDFPRNFVVKANHGSGALVICWEGAHRGATLPHDISNIFWEKYLIHPDDLNWEDLINLSNKWMTLNYSGPRGVLEWAYQDISPKILVETVITESGVIPSDYKLFMIAGKCEFIQVDTSRYEEHRRNLFLPDWEKCEATIVIPEYDGELLPPVSLSQMLELSSIIAKDLDFIRIDWYNSDEGLKFGELTNYPGGGAEEITPVTQSIKWARNWKQKYCPEEFSGIALSNRHTFSFIFNNHGSGLKQ